MFYKFIYIRVAQFVTNAIYVPCKYIHGIRITDSEVFAIFIIHVITVPCIFIGDRMSNSYLVTKIFCKDRLTFVANFCFPASEKWSPSLPKSDRNILWCLKTCRQSDFEQAWRMKMINFVDFFIQGNIVKSYGDFAEQDMGISILGPCCFDQIVYFRDGCANGVPGHIICATKNHNGIITFSDHSGQTLLQPLSCKSRVWITAGLYSIRTIGNEVSLTPGHGRTNNFYIDFLLPFAFNFSTKFPLILCLSCLNRYIFQSVITGTFMRLGLVSGRQDGESIAGFDVKNTFITICMRFAFAFYVFWQVS